MMLPLVCVVVLSWNGRDDTIDCLKSLERVIDPRPKVILVDNGSTDGTADAVRHDFPGVEVIESGENLGYPGGNNLGIRRALDHGAEYVLILNNDTVVDPGFVRELLAVASRSERIGFVSPKIYFMDPPDLIWFAGARFYAWCGYGKMVGYHERERGRHDQVREIDRPCGCAMLVSRRLCEEVGLMDPSLFLYADEIEWMLRAKKRGFKAFYASKAKVWHKVSASVGQEGHPDSIYYGVRNTLYALNAHARCVIPPLNPIRNIAVVAIFLIALSRSPTTLGPGARAIAAGVRDYMRGVSGRRDFR